MLDRLEQDITAQINRIQSNLVPLERELANVRRAKAALDKDDRAIGPSRIVLGAAPIVKIAPASPYQNLTMKRLIVKALREHFLNGATAKMLIEFFANAWGRTDIIRASLSPQLSRLKTDGVIDRKGLVWHLVIPDTEETPSSSEPSASDNHGDGSGVPSSSGSYGDGDLLTAPPGANPAEPGE